MIISRQELEKRLHNKKWWDLSISVNSMGLIFESFDLALESAANLALMRYPDVEKFKLKVSGIVVEFVPVSNDGK